MLSNHKRWGGVARRPLAGEGLRGGHPETDRQGQRVWGLCNDVNEGDVEVRVRVRVRLCGVVGGWEGGLPPRTLPRSRGSTCTQHRP